MHTNRLAVEFSSVYDSFITFNLLTSSLFTSYCVVSVISLFYFVDGFIYGTNHELELIFLIVLILFILFVSEDIFLGVFSFINFFIFNLRVGMQVIFFNVLGQNVNLFFFRYI